MKNNIKTEIVSLIKYKMTEEEAQLIRVDEKVVSTIEQIKRLRYKFLILISAKTCFDELECKNDIEVLKRYNYFFRAMKLAFKQYFLLELAKLFDKDSRTLSVVKLFKSAKDNYCVLSDKNELIKNFEKTNKQKYTDDYFDSWEMLSQEKLLEIDETLKLNKENIEKIIGIRNKFIAHNESLEEINISRDCIDDLLSVVDQILSIFESCLENKRTISDNFKKEPVEEIEMLFNDLNRIVYLNKEYYGSNYDVKKISLWENSDIDLKTNLEKETQRLVDRKKNNV